MTASSVARFETSFALSLKRFVDGMSTREVLQYGSGTAVCVAALERYLAAPAANGMHPLVARQFDLERARARKLLFNLSHIIAARDATDPALANIRRRIEGKSEQQIKAIYDELTRERREPNWVAYLSRVLAEMEK